MSLNEAETRAKLIDPAIHKRGWTEDLIRREVTARTVDVINGKARRSSLRKADYVLRVGVKGWYRIRLADVKALAARFNYPVDEELLRSLEK